MVFVSLLSLGAMVGVIVALKILADNMADVAYRKGYGKEIHAWAWCFCLGIFGYIYILGLPDKSIQKQNQEIIDLLKEQNELLKKEQNEISVGEALPSI